MLRLAICSEPERARASTRSPRCGRGLALARALLVSFTFAAPAAAQQATTQEEALAAAFPAPAVIERRTAYLSGEQLEAVQRAAGKNISQSVVSYYVASRNGRPIGVAYFDSHRVRTLSEVVMVLVSPDDRIRRIEVLKFMEPPEYRAPEPWLDQFTGKTLTPALHVKRDIVNMTGATLTSRAVTEAVRRVLALHDVIAPFADAR